MDSLRALALSVALGTLPGTLHAAEHPIAGDLLRLRDGARPRVRFRVTDDAAIVASPGVDPRLTGASLEIADAAGGSSGTVGLPAPGWRGLGDPPGAKGFRWLARRAPDGIRKVVLRWRARGGMLFFAGGGPRWGYRLSDGPEAIDVALSIGTELYCARFASPVGRRRHRLVARNAPPPPACPRGAPPARCGDAVVEGEEECDDGNARGSDGCSETCLVEDSPCGDGTLGPGEECDDANRDGGDGCSPVCQLESAAGLCAGVATASGTALDAELVVSGLDSPVHLAAPPLDPTRLFVVEQPGRVRIIENGTLRPEPFLDIVDRVSCCGERGLLSLAFHPDYETNRVFFVAYTDNAGATVVARYTASDDPNRAETASGRVLLAVPQFESNHNGGHVVFGPDGFLYLGLGDGGGRNDPQETGQDGSELLGKILRLDVDTVPGGYVIPSSNPFVGPGPPRDEIWALGLRNPWRMTFDRATGDLYVGDVGQGAREEIDVQPATSPGGENYGWDVFEGTLCHEPEPPAGVCPDPPTGFTMPVLEYDHGEGCSVTGGHVYRGCAIPDLRGTYFFADYCTGFIRTFAGVVDGVAEGRADRTADLRPGGGRTIDNPSSFGEDARGELYVVDYDGEVFRIVPAR